MQTATVRVLPLLIYDGDCGFCIYWVNYWRRLTGNRVAYAPYQEVAPQYPEIPLTAFQRAVQYIAPDGKIASGAEAALLALSHAGGKGFWLTLYRHLPGFAAISELIYAFVASHRAEFYRPSLWLWGRDYEPPRFDLVTWLFLRAIGLIYLAAFVSFGVQALGLKLFAASPAAALTAIRSPQGIDSGKLIKEFRESFDAVVANGQGEMKGQLFRIAHIGY